MRRVIGVLFLFVGVLQVIFCIAQSFRAVVASFWPTTPAVIQSSEVLEIHDDEGGTTWKPKVSYTYQVNGVSYVGTRIYFDDVGAFPAQARDTAARFPARS